MRTRLTLILLASLAGGCCDPDSCESPCHQGDAGSGDATPVDLGGPCARHRTLWTSADPIIDLFVKGDKILVVHQRAVVLLDPYGRVLVTRGHERELQTAALDGEILAVSDSSELTWSGPTLRPASTIPLKEQCSQTVFVGNERLVCGQDETGKPLYTTFDLKAGSELAAGANFGWGKWRPMRRVPGTDDFVTTEPAVSPYDFVLYRVDPGSHEVSEVCDSPYGSSVKDVTDIFAFDRGGVNLVTRTGTKRRIMGADVCMGSPTEGYFIKNGTLASLAAGEFFLGMDDDAARGKIVGLVASDVQCSAAGGCSAVKIDVDSDAVLARRSVALDLQAVIRLRHDAFCGGFAVAYLDAAGGFRVDRIGLD